MVEATVAKRFVEVAEVVVDWSPVKFWRVEEPLARRFENVPSPEMVSAPEPVMFPVAREEEKSSVEDAVSEKKVVEVPFPRVSVPRFARVA